MGETPREQKTTDSRFGRLTEFSKLLMLDSSILLWVIVLFSLALSWKLDNVWIIIAIVPSAFGLEVVGRRFYYRKAEAENLIKLQNACKANMTPEQYTGLIEVLMKAKLDSDTTGTPVEPYANTNMGLDDYTENIQNTKGVEG